MQPNGVHRWYFKLRLFGLTWFIVWNIKVLRHWVAKILGSENRSLRQRLNSFKSLPWQFPVYGPRHKHIGSAICILSFNEYKCLKTFGQSSTPSQRWTSQILNRRISRSNRTKDGSQKGEVAALRVEIAPRVLE